MRDSRQEVTLTTERLHWGIFIPVIIVAMSLLVMMLPVLFFMRVTTSMLGQLNPQSSSQFSWLWAIVLVPDVAISGLLFLVTWFAYSKSEITLTNQRLTFRTGFLSRMSGELPLENVETIILMEPLLGRLFGYGTVAVSGLGGSTFPLRFISKPQRFHFLLQKAVGDAKTPRRPLATAQKSPPPDDDSRYMPKG